MAFFNIKNGRIEQKMTNTNNVDESDVDWLVDRLILHDDILPEKLLVIGRGRSKKFGSDMRYLLGLDKNAALTLVFVSKQAPGKQNIGSVCDLAWALRNPAYKELENIAKRHFKNFGVTIDSLAGLHAQHFNIEHSIRPRRFNETQQVILLAPNYDQISIDAICWRRAEIDISAFSFNLVEVENGERLLFIHPEIKGGAISSVMSAIGGVPSALIRKIFRSERNLGN